MKKIINKITNYVKDSYNELVHKVSWPSRDELTNSAVVVMCASLIMAGIIFCVDFVFENAIKFLYGVL